MGSLGHVDLLLGLGEKSRPKSKKAAPFGCGLLENLADLDVQRCRRTWRAPASSLVRRRSAARRMVRFKIMGRAHTADAWTMSRQPIADPVLKAINLGAILQ